MLSHKDMRGSMYTRRTSYVQRAHKTDANASLSWQLTVVSKREKHYTENDSVGSLRIQLAYAGAWKRLMTYMRNDDMQQASNGAGLLRLDELTVTAARLFALPCGCGLLLGDDCALLADGVPPVPTTESIYCHLLSPLRHRFPPVSYWIVLLNPSGLLVRLPACYSFNAAHHGSCHVACTPKLENSKIWGRTWKEAGRIHEISVR